MLGDLNTCQHSGISVFRTLPDNLLLYTSRVSNVYSIWQCHKTVTIFCTHKEWKQRHEINTSKLADQKCVIKFVTSCLYISVFNSPPICWIIKCTFQPLVGCSLNCVALKSHKMTSNRARPLTAHGVAFVWHCTRPNLSGFKRFLQFLHTGQQSDVWTNLHNVLLNENNVRNIFTTLILVYRSSWVTNSCVPLLWLLFDTSLWMMASQARWRTH